MCLNKEIVCIDFGKLSTMKLLISNGQPCYPVIKLDYYPTSIQFSNS